MLVGAVSAFLAADGTIYGVVGAEGEGVNSYLVGVTGDSSFYYDTPELTVQDAFLSFGPSTKETKN